MEITKQIKTVGIIGHFAEGLDMADGQVVKTRTVRELLRDVCGNENVRSVDTRGWQKQPIALIRECTELAKFSDVLIMLPAHNGLKVFAPLLINLRKRHGCKVVYSVIGGWLAEFIAGQSLLTKKLKSFDAILVESQRVKALLTDQGFENVLVAYNYKRLPLLESSELEKPSGEPWPLAVFSRIYEDKGIDDIVWAVRKANSQLGRRAFRLDIYGNVLAEYKEHFHALMADCDVSEVAYKGVAPAGENTSVLNGYLALTFPTRYPGEGVPGTVVDAYCAGIPVIASQWPSYAEMVQEGETGLTYEFCNREALLDILLNPRLPKQLLEMKKSCLHKGHDYSYETGLRTFKLLVESNFDVHKQ